MNLFDQYLENLEFRSLLRLLEGRATFEGGRRHLAGLTPLATPEAINSVQDLVAELRKLFEQGESLGFSSLEDIRPALGLLRIQDTVLEVAQLLRVLEVIRSSVRSRRLLASAEESPALVELARSIPPLIDAVTFLEDRLDPSGEIPDRASPELAAVRRQIRTLSEEIHTRYQDLLARAARSGALQDHYVTTRNGRFVIPLRADAPGSMKGVVHGSSSSGLTVFVEPFDMVPLNNRFTSLKDREEEIVALILAQMSDYLRGRWGDLDIAYGMICQLDSLAARARYAGEFGCVRPDISEAGELVLEEARHPLLESVLRPQGREVVSISLALTRETPCLVISGPNTGGKTAAMKTAGLLTLMALAGIPVPARQMRVGVFHHVFAAIGDRQSLSEDLSTFSSHILFLRHMLEHYSHPSLILVDEIGTGTDPDEGSALGMAFLDRFLALGAPMVVTTHSRALKEFALTRDGVETAAVEMDPDTLRPTYRLRLGSLGVSSGLFIGRRLGLPDALVDEAEERLSSAGRLSDEVLRRLNDLVARREMELADITRIKHDHILKKIDMERRTEEKRREIAGELRREFQEAVRAFEKEKKQFFTDARRQLDAAVASATASAAGAARLQTRLDKVEERSGRVVAAAEEAMPAISPRKAPRPAEARPVEAHELAVGLPVLVGPLRSEGTIVDLGPDGVTVLAGGKRVRVPAGWLAHQAAAAPASGGARSARSQKLPPPRPAEADEEPEEVSAEINVIGKTVDEVLPELDRFLDGAFRQERRRVAVIHGLGKGILRRAIHEHLRSVPFVTHYYHPPRNEGGEGKTVIELDLG